MNDWKRIHLRPGLRELYKCSHLYVHVQKQDEFDCLRELPFAVYSRWPLRGFKTWHDYLKSARRKLSFFADAPLAKECNDCGLFGVSSTLFEEISADIEWDLLRSVWKDGLYDLIYRCCVVQGYVPRHLRIVDYDSAIHCELPQFLPLVVCNIIGDYLIQYLDDKHFQSENGVTENKFDDAQENFLVHLYGKEDYDGYVRDLSDDDFSTMIQIQQGLPHTFRHSIVSQFWSQHPSSCRKGL